MKTPIGRFSFCLVLCVLAVTDTGGAQASGPATLRTVTVEGAGPFAVITLNLDQGGVRPGPLEEITTPPLRLFVDLPNVIPRVAAVTQVGRGGVDRVRVALNQASPPVTRVVFDLTHRSTFRLEQDAEGRSLRVVIGTPPPAESTHPTTEPVDPSTQLPADLSAYLTWFDDSTAKVERLLARVGSEVGLQETVDGQVVTWVVLRQDIETTPPPSSLQVAHDLLAAAVGLGAVASDTALRAGESTAETASALAGARLLVAQARTNVLDVLTE